MVIRRRGPRRRERVVGREESWEAEERMRGIEELAVRGRRDREVIIWWVWFHR